MNKRIFDLLLFKEEWKKLKIGEIFTDIYRGNRVATAYKGTGNFPSVISGDMRTLNDMSFSKCKTFIREDVVKGKLCQKGDILVIHESMSKGIVGKFFLYEGDNNCAVANEIYVLKHNQNPKYLVHVLNSFYVQKQVRAISSKKTESERKSRIKIPDLKKISIYIPPLHIQDQIADYLDSLFKTKNKISEDLELLLEKRKKQYEWFKETLLVGGIDRWDIVSLSEIATDIYLGNEVTKSQLGTGDYPAIKCGDVNSAIPLNFDTCISFVNFDLIKNPRFFNHGDILMGALAHNIKSIGKVSLYLGKEKCIVGNDVIVIRSNQNQKYLAYCLSSKFCRKQLEKLSLPGAVVHLYVKNVNKIQIPLPSLEEQEEIVSLLDSCTEYLRNIESNIFFIRQKRQKQYTYFSNLLISCK